MVRLREFSSARQDKFMVKITDMNENSLGTKIVVADLKWGGSTDAGELAKKAQKVAFCFSPTIMQTPQSSLLNTLSSVSSSSFHCLSFLVNFKGEEKRRPEVNITHHGLFIF